MACKLQVAGLFSGKGSLIHFPTNKCRRYIFREKAFVVIFNNVKVTKAVRNFARPTANFNKHVQGKKTMC